MTTSTYRGHNITINTDKEWVFDNGKKVSDNIEIRCGKCNKNPTTEGHDACLKTLPCVMNACCGHGDLKQAYIQLLDGTCVRGKHARMMQRILMEAETNHG